LNAEILPNLLWTTQNSSSRASGETPIRAARVLPPQFAAPPAPASTLPYSRLLAIENDGVLFRYKDYRDGGEWKTKWIPGVEFIARFLRHVLPNGLRRIPRFAF
jgi:hypothetical protein